MNQNMIPNQNGGQNPNMMPNPYQNQMQMGQKTSGLGVASMVLGIVGLLLIYFFIGVVPCAIGFILGIIALFEKNTSKGPAIAGVVCSAVGILFLIFILVYGEVDDDEYYYYDDDYTYYSGYAADALVKYIED